MHLRMRSAVYNPLVFAVTDVLGDGALIQQWYSLLERCFHIGQSFEISRIRYF